MCSNIGTIEYLAPEVIQGYCEYSEQIDLWAAGLILYYMIVGNTPFFGLKYFIKINKFLA